MKRGYFMSGKQVDDYLKDGIHGSKKPLQAERNYFLGTLKERIVYTLTIGQVMQQKGLFEMAKRMAKNSDAKLLLNGDIASRYLSELKANARQHHISYTVVSNHDTETDIGAVLTVDYAIHHEDIFYKEETNKQEEINDNTKERNSFLDKIKKIFRAN